MEEACIRFPLVAQKVLKEIDYQSLTKLKEASRNISEFLDRDRILWRQIILKKITGNSLSIIEHLLLSNCTKYQLL